MKDKYPLKSTFATWTEQMAEHNGKPFTILSMEWWTPEDHGGDNAEPMFNIRFADGTEILAHVEEVFDGWLG